MGCRAGRCILRRGARQFLGESVARHADVVFPGEAYAEKEGTITHPDGRLQRLRPAIGRPGEVRMEWQVLLELAARLRLAGEAPTAAAVFAELRERCRSTAA